jgi:hypothetical protein
VYEGIAAQVAWLARAAGDDLGKPLERLRVDGGLTRSPSPWPKRRHLSTTQRHRLDAADRDHMLYPMVMARKEVLVQLDDELVRRLDALAARLGTSRSELVRRGALAVLEAEELAVADRRLVEAYRAQPQDPAIVEAAARLAAETAPPW